jgi:hypothetical protein
MPKHLLLLVTFIFFTGCFLCEAQSHMASAKNASVSSIRTGTLSTSSSSGGGAGGFNCTADINTGNLSLLNPTTAAFCLNDSNMVLRATYDFDSYSGWYYNDPQSFSALTSFEDAFGGVNVIINKPGIYYFRTDQGCTVGILVTSVIPLDSVPNQTIFCPNGSITLNAPVGDFSSYQWFNDSDSLQGENSDSYVASNTGNYYAQITNSNGCILNSDKINVTVYTPPSQLNITGDSCVNSSLVLDNTTTDLNPDTVTWYRNGSPIKSFDDHGIVVAGGNGAGNGLNQLDQPYGIFLDSMKNVYVADYGNYRIMKWAPGSTSGEIIAGNLSQFGGNPTDVLLDSQSLYISTINGILKFSPPFNMDRLSFGNAWGLSISSDHNLYFAHDADVWHTVPGGIFKIDLTGTIDTVAGQNGFGSDLSNINYPNGIYLDLLNNLYVSDNVIDSSNNYYSRIVKWAPGATTGELIAAGNGHGNAPNQIWYAAGVTFDKTGNMYVSDAVNNRVQLWKPGADHGITIASGFTPWGIRVDDDGNVYVADQTNNQVLKFPSMLHNIIKADSPGVYKAVVIYPGGCTATSNDFTVQNCPLPVKLLNFAGQLKNNYAALTWETASEYNTSYFNVQRSLDNINFTTIAKVFPSGGSNSLHNYVYDDNNITDLNVTKIYYRVNEIDIDGTSALSNSILIDLMKIGGSFTVSPNPVKSSLVVQLYNFYGSANVTLFDMAGRMLTVQLINASGNNVLNFNTGNLSGGIYFIQVINNGQRKYLQFVKE